MSGVSSSPPSPYAGLPVPAWQAKTDKIIAQHPLSADVIVASVLQSWSDIFESKFGRKGFRIGTDIFPKPQIMGFLLHELIPLELASRQHGCWRNDTSDNDKDVVCIKSPRYSIEIKTSSHATKIFGNRSYAQQGAGPVKKAKSGYYLAVNFGKFTARNRKPQIRRIRFGWLDHTDWVGQTAATGQQAHLQSDAERFKLKTLYVEK